jgi:transcriptional regulator with XRE-family HTH domain
MEERIRGHRRGALEVRKTEGGNVRVLRKKKGRDMARTRSVHSQSKQHGSDKEEAETLLNLHKQYIGLHSRIAKRLGVDASYVSRIANGERQSEKLRLALLSELGLTQAAA